MSRTLALISAFAAAPACTTSMTYEEFDRYARSTDARTILHEPDFSVYSPFDVDGTKPYLELAREHDRPLRAFFASEPTLPWILVLAPSEELAIQAELHGDQMVIKKIPMRRKSGIAAMATDRTALVYVMPPSELRRDDGSILKGGMSPKHYTKDLRHELVHLYGRYADLDADPWFNEALAELLEDAPLADGRLRIDDVATTWTRLARVPPEEWDLRRVFALREDPRQLEAGTPHPFPAARALARSFLQFLLLRSGSQDTLGELRRIGSESQSELLALEPEWRAWLARGLEEHAATLQP